MWLCLRAVTWNVDVVAGCLRALTWNVDVIVFESSDLKQWCGCVWEHWPETLMFLCLRAVTWNNDVVVFESTDLKHWCGCRLFEKVRNLAQDPMRAARAYQSIVQSINQAEAAAKQALKTAEDTVRIVRFVLWCVNYVRLCQGSAVIFPRIVWLGHFLGDSRKKFLSNDILLNKKYCCDLVCCLFYCLCIWWQ